MAHEILSVKLCELDEAIGRMRNRIPLCESARHERLKQELERLEGEWKEKALSLSQKLRFSKSPLTLELFKVYNDIEKRIQHTSFGTNPEDQILLAEYALDFAIQAANRALLLSLKAIDAEMTQQEKEELSK